LGPTDRAIPVSGPSGCYMKTDTESSLQNVVLIENRTIGNVQKLSNCKIVVDQVYQIFSTALCCPKSLFHDENNNSPKGL
jgi:hypothetical protein